VTRVGSTALGSRNVFGPAHGLLFAMFVVKPARHLPLALIMLAEAPDVNVRVSAGPGMNGETSSWTEEYRIGNDAKITHVEES
jgi:hypothetical protein